jgi:cell wall-associated NlpC family hydrolase
LYVFKWIKRVVMLLLAPFIGMLGVMAVILVGVLALGLIIAAFLAAIGRFPGSSSGVIDNLTQNTEFVSPSAIAIANLSSSKMDLVMQVASQSSCGNSWQVLAAIGQIEDSSFGSKMAIGPTVSITQNGRLVHIHAYGPAQFLINTYNGIDNADPPAQFVEVNGIPEEQPPPPSAHIWQTQYAYKAMDKYLCQSGAGTNLPGAIFAYNHSQDYVNSVLQLAASYGTAPPATAGGQLPGNQIVASASRFLSPPVPYVFGGTTFAGIDCSGLVGRTYQPLGDPFRFSDPAHWI